MNSNSSNNNDIERVIFSASEIAAAVDKLAARLNADYKGRTDVVFVCILKGSAIFFADLVRKLEFPVLLDYMALSSYGMSAQSTGEVTFVKDISMSLTDKDVVIVEDIIDSGLTLKYLIGNIALKRPRSVKVCAVFDKPSGRKTDFVGDYVGLEVPGEFVVGYGLDYAERYRELPYLGVLKRSVYEK